MNGWEPALASPADLRRGDRAVGARAFTLLELLIVIALIGILAALLFPAVGAARRGTQAARTRVQFAQWTAAIEAFRSEYGHYPAFDASGLVNGGAASSPSGEHLFHDVLAGRRRDGTTFSPEDAAPGSAAVQNRKRLRFHAFAAGEITDAADPRPHLVRDASGATEVAVLVDRDLDGMIRIGPGGDYATAPAVGGAAPGVAELPAAGIRAGVLFYAPAPGSTAAEPRFVCSWK